MMQQAKANTQNQVRSSFNYQKQEKTQIQKTDQYNSKKGDIGHTGFQFECYTRDHMVKEEAKKAKEFQLGQRDFEHHRNQMDYQHRREPDATVMSQLELAKLRKQAED